MGQHEHEVDVVAAGDLGQPHTHEHINALFAAIHANNPAGVEALLRVEPALLEATSPSGLTPVMFAAYYRRPDILRVLLGAGAPRVAIEAGVGDGWWKYGCAAVVSIDTFGESAPAAELFRHFGFTPQNVVDTVRRVLKRRVPI